MGKRTVLLVMALEASPFRCMGFINIRVTLALDPHRN